MCFCMYTKLLILLYGNWLTRSIYRRYVVVAKYKDGYEVLFSSFSGSYSHVHKEADKYLGPRGNYVIIPYVEALKIYAV